MKLHWVYLSQSIATCEPTSCRPLVLEIKRPRYRTVAVSETIPTRRCRSNLGSKSPLEKAKAEPCVLDRSNPLTRGDRQSDFINGFSNATPQPEKENPRCRTIG